MHTEELADALIARLPDVVDKTKLQKLMYYANAWHLAITGSALVPLDFQAWKLGPVLPSIWHSRAMSEARDPRNARAVALDDFTASLLDMVIDEYGHRGSGELSEMTHTERPWLAARGELPLDEPSSAPIDAKTIAAHYRADHSLCGHMASELAVLGLPSSDDRATVEMGRIFEPVRIEDMPDDDWGGANLFDLSQPSAR